MFGQPSAMPSDKLMRLFIVQSISSFVARDYESGLHYLNEIKRAYAEHMGTLNPTLKSIAKEIIQSLDMFAPGATSDMFLDTNQPDTPQQMEPEHYTSPQQEIASHFKPAQQPTNTVQDNPQPGHSVSSDLQDLLEKRRAKRRKRDQGK